MHEPRVSQHAVIGRISSGQVRVEARSHSTLGSFRHSAAGPLRGDQPPGRQCHGVNVRGLTGLHSPVKAGFNTRNLYMRQKRSMKIVVISDNHRVSAQGA